MIVKCEGFITDIREVESKTDSSKKYLNCNVRSNPYDYDYLAAGVRLPRDKELPSNLKYVLVLDVSQSWVDRNNSGKKTCFTHITLVDYFIKDRDAQAGALNNL